MKKIALRTLPLALLLAHPNLFGQAADSAANTDRQAAAAPAATQQLIDQPTIAVSPRQQQMMDIAQAQSDSTEVMWLETNSESFLGLYEKAVAAEPEGAALILHDNGQHPDWPILVQGIRMGLADQGWHTLAIELPVIPEAEALTQAPANTEAAASTDDGNDQDPDIPAALREQTLARITAAIDKLNQQSSAPLTLIGIGTGGYWATQYYADQPADPSQTLTLIDTQAPYADMAQDYAQTLAGALVRTLDLYHGNPSPSDPNSQAAQQRKDASKRAQRSNYLQRRLPVRPYALAADNERLLKTFIGVYRKQLALEAEAQARTEAAAQAAMHKGVKRKAGTMK